MTEILITREGKRRLAAELAQLHAEREAIVVRIQRALEQGGAHAENGEFLDARNEQEILDRRILLLERRLHAAEVVEPERDGTVDIGERVRVRDLIAGETADYRIVGTGEGDPATGDISHASPVGTALLGRRVGDIVEVTVPTGVLRLEILAIED